MRTEAEQNYAAFRCSIASARTNRDFDRLATFAEWLVDRSKRLEYELAAYCEVSASLEKKKS